MDDIDMPKVTPSDIDAYVSDNVAAATLNGPVESLIKAEKPFHGSLNYQEYKKKKKVKQSDTPTNTMDAKAYACGNVVGTLYGPAKYLTKAQRRFRRMNYEEYLKYEKKVEQTGGFDVDGCTGVMPGRICPLSKGSYEWKVAIIIALHAATKQGEAMGKTIEYIRLIKANTRSVAGILYYLTFLAANEDQLEKTYRAQVWRKPSAAWKCEIVLFLDGANGKKDITLKTKDDKNIKFNLRSYFGEPVEVPQNPTIEPTDEEILANCCHVLAEQLKSENPELTDAEAASNAASKWSQFKYSEKAPFYDEAWKMFKRQNSQYYPDCEL